jgi:hypothetical protein
MLGRIFGRGKDEPDQAVCASCGRTLLAGEWTQKISDEDGEKLICSLCGQARPLAEGEPVRGTITPANDGKVRESRSESDAFWKALKDKDLEIERLEALLARAEAEKQELLGRLARSGGSTPDAVQAEIVAGVGAQPASQAELGDETPELAAETWGETPAELAAALAEFETMQAPEAEPAPEATAGEPPAVAFEDTQPIAVGEGLPEAGVEVTGDDADDDEPAADVAADEPAADDTAEIVAPQIAAPQVAAPIAPLLAGDEQADTPAQAEGDAEGEQRDVEAAEREADAAASLTLLQRGVDLLNVSTVPRKIAETNEHLGLPSVHVGFDGQTVAVTFLWSMGWYRFAVDIDSGAVRMDERGYEERRDLQPNAGVRADGTVHLAPAQISRAAAQKQAATQTAQTAQPAEPAEPAEASASNEPAEAEPPSVAAQKAPEFVSKSLLGQRSDDEANPWDQTKARDFNWDR